MKPDSAKEALLGQVLSLTHVNHTLNESDTALPPPGKSETHVTMERGQVQDMIAASEARTDTKFAKMDGKLDVLLEKMAAVTSAMADVRSSNAATKAAVDASADRAEAEGRQTRRTYRTTAISTAIGLTALMIALFGLFINSYNLGASGKSVPAVIGVAPTNSTLLLEDKKVP